MTEESNSPQRQEAGTLPTPKGETPFIEMRGISKRFGGVRALEGVNLSIRSAEIHSLAGENGCGKSTLIKVLSGVHVPDEGQIILEGKLTRISRQRPLSDSESKSSTKISRCFQTLQWPRTSRSGITWKHRCGWQTSK